jgi:nucleotide-binding universal stress UspA family protein
MYKSLIVPLDGSALAEQAVATATAFAKKSGAKVHLIRVHNPYPQKPYRGPLMAPTDARWDRNVRRRETKYLSGVAASMKEALGRSVPASLKDGTVVEAICAFARTLPAPLLVMSTHGAAGQNRRWLGSTADRVIRVAPCPILLVRPLAEQGRRGAPAFPQRLLIPLDGSPEAEAIVDWVFEFGVAAPLEVDLVEVITPGPHSPLYWLAASELGKEQMDDLEHQELAYAKANLDEVAMRIRQALPGTVVQTDVRLSGHAATGILEAAAEHGADLLAMTTHGRGASRLVLGSVIDKVLRGSSAAMLVVRPEPRAAVKKSRRPARAASRGTP